MVDFTFKELDYPEFVDDVRQAVLTSLVDFGSARRTKNGAKIIIINEYPALKQVREKYSFLSGSALLLETPPAGSSPIHVDGMVRKFVINVPLFGMHEENKVCFYDPDTVVLNTDHINASETYYIPINETVEPIAQYTLMNNPVIVHTMIPHQIVNYTGSETRTSFSWVLDCEEYSQQAIEQLVDKIEKESKSC